MKVVNTFRAFAIFRKKFFFIKFRTFSIFKDI